MTEATRHEEFDDALTSQPPADLDTLEALVRNHVRGLIKLLNSPPSPTQGHPS